MCSTNLCANSTISMDCGATRREQRFPKLTPSSSSSFRSATNSCPERNQRSLDPSGILMPSPGSSERWLRSGQLFVADLKLLDELGVSFGKRCSRRVAPQSIEIVEFAHRFVEHMH